LSFETEFEQDSFTIPDQLVKAWVELPDSSYPDLKLTKKDLDHLFFAFTQMVRANNNFQSSVAELSRGHTDSATLFNQEATRLFRHADSNFRRFFFAVMLSATRREGA